jgi:phosphatidylserine decarboxylase
VFAPGAGRWIAPPALVAVVLGGLAAARFLAPPAEIAVVALAVLGATAAIFLVVFFRDPQRSPGEGIVSAADGRVRAIENDGERLRISVFMNVTNVHVNRLPLDATVAEVTGSGAGYIPAYRAESSRNVQRRYTLTTSLGTVHVDQITGVVARRLVSFVAPGWTGRKGDRFGMIVLGSRVDVELPAARATAAVRVGDRVRAGNTPIAREVP